MAEIFLVTLCGVMAGGEGWEDIEDDGEAQLELLRELLPYAAGVPSDETLRRFFRRVDAAACREVCVAFVRQMMPEAGARLIAMDGKTLRGSHDGAGKARHLGSALATEARLVLAQMPTPEQRNEITAMPALLRMLDRRGATVASDAMGCQRSIAEQIVTGGGEYVLGRKGNQGTRHEDVRLFFEQPPAGTAFLTHEEADTGHGRIATRHGAVTRDMAWLQETHHWPA